MHRCCAVAGARTTTLKMDHVNAFKLSRTSAFRALVICVVGFRDGMSFELWKLTAMCLQGS